MRVPKVIVLLLLSSICAFAPPQFPPAIQLDEIRKRPCEIELPEGFNCAVLFDVGLPASDGMIASIVAEDVAEISVYLGGTLYTIAYDPPLKRDEKFFHLRRGMQVPVRIERNDLILQWPNRTRCTGKIIRREAIFPNQPQAT